MNLNKIIFLTLIFFISLSYVSAIDDIETESNLTINEFETISDNNLIDAYGYSNNQNYSYEYEYQDYEDEIDDEFSFNDDEFGEDLFHEDYSDDELDYNYSTAYMDISINDITYGQTAQINSYLHNETSYLQNKSIQIQVEDKVYYALTDENGYFTYNLTDYNIGLNTVIFLFEDDEYNEVAFGQFNVYKTDTTTKITRIEEYDNQTIIICNVTNEFGNVVTDGYINLINNITNISSAVIDGTATFILDANINEDFLIEYTGSNVNNPSMFKSQQTSTKINTQIIIDSINCTVGNTINLSARIIDENGNNVDGGKVVFKLNGLTVKDDDGYVIYGNVSNGKSSISYTTPLNWFSKTSNMTRVIIISSVYSGTSIYNSSYGDGNLTVSKRTTGISISTPQQAKLTETITLTATLIDSLASTNGVIIFKINGLTIKDDDGNTVYVDVINNKAQYDYTIPIELSAKNYTFTAVYSSPYYQRIENTTNITINRLNTYIKTITQHTDNDTIHIETEFYDEYDNLIIGNINYAIKINGKTYLHNTTTNSTIDTILENSFKQGTYTFEFVMGLNKRYNSSRNTTNITLEKTNINIQTSNLYRCNYANIQLKINNQLINTITRLEAYIDESNIYNSTINTNNITFNQYIPIEYEGKHLLKLKIYNNNTLTYTTSKVIYIQSHYIYVNSQGNSNNYGLSKNDYTTLRNALQITNPGKIILLSTNKTKDTYNMTDIILNQFTTTSHQINIIGEKGKKIIFDGHNFYRCFTINNDYHLTLLNINFINGYADHGGVFVNEGNLTLINNTFCNNNALLDAGIINNIANLTLIKNTIYNNSIINNTRYIVNEGKTADGGVIVSEKGNVILMYNQFYENKAHYGGVILVKQGNVNLINNNFFNHHVKYSGGVLYSNNSTVFSYNNSYFNNSAKYGSVSIIAYSLAYFFNDKFKNNYANEYGTLYFNESISEIYQSIFYNNSAKYGAGIYIKNSDILLNKTIFIHGKAFSHGGSISSTNSNIQINNSIFELNNVVNGVGGSLYIENTNSLITNSSFVNNSARQGGAIIVIDENVNNLENNNFTHNTADEGGALYTTKSVSYVNNCIFDNNTSNKYGTIYSQLSYNLNVENSIFNNNHALNYKDIYTVETVSNIYNNKIYSNNLSSVLVDGFTSNINNNYWGSNNPNFTVITNNNIPKTWIIIENNTESIKYQHQIKTVNGGKTKLIITSNNNNQVILQKPKKDIDITVDDILTKTNQNITINITFNEKINSIIQIKFSNSTIINKTLNNTDTLKINYKTSSTETLDKIIIILPESDEYQQKIENLNIFTQNNISSFNLLNYNMSTPIKNQFNSLACWAFASISSLESSIVKEYNKTYDFSENHLKNIINKYSIVGTNVDANTGSSLLRPLNYMVSWFDPILEKQENFYEKSTISTIINPAYHVQDAIIIQPIKRSNIQEYKNLLLKYGEIYTDFNSDGKCDINLINVSNEIKNNTVNYYTYKNVSPSHAITIIGWDDNYSRYNFNNNGNIPDGDGAFIIKNSWGITNGINGTNYVSYYDKSIAIRGSIVFSTENKNNYTSIYQYESCSISTINNIKSIYLANNFKANNNEQIQAIGTFFNNPSNYTISIYKNGIEQYTQDGQITQTSYKTIPLKEYIPVNKNDNFTAIIKITSEHKTYAFVQDSTNMASQNITNQSYISYDGNNWINLQEYKLTACLKVYTGHTYNTTQHNTTTNKQLYINLIENKPIATPAMAKDHAIQDNSTYNLMHYIVKLPSTESFTQNGTSINKNLTRNFYFTINNKEIMFNNYNPDDEYFITNNGEIYNNTFEKEGICIKKNIIENKTEIHFIYNLTKQINTLSVNASLCNTSNGNMSKIVIKLNNEKEIILNLLTPSVGNISIILDDILTQLIINNQNIQRTERIIYERNTTFYQTYTIVNTKINNKTYIEEINKMNNTVEGNFTKIGLTTLYFNDLFSELIASILNITYKRENYTIILSGKFNDRTYVHIADPTMAMNINTTNENKIIFRLLTTYMLSLWEEKALNFTGIKSEGALTKVINSLENNTYKMFEDENYTYIVVKDESETTIKIDKNTGIMIDYIKIGGNIYHGTVADDQHNALGFEVGSPQADFERFVGTTMMASSGYLLAAPGGIFVAAPVYIIGAIITADGCGLTNPNQWTDKNLVNFASDVLTSFPYAHALGYISKFEKLTAVITTIERIDKSLVKVENTFRTYVNNINGKLLPFFERTMDVLTFENVGINQLTQSILNSYSKIFKLNVPRKEFSKFFDFIFEMDKKALFEGSHLDLATHEIFCNSIDQLPSRATMVTYVGYGFAKTTAEEATKHVTGKLVNFVKDSVTGIVGNVTSEGISKLDNKRWYDLSNVESKEYFYVAEVPLFVEEDCCYEVLS